MREADEKGSSQTISANNSHRRTSRSEFDFIHQLRAGGTANPPNSFIGDDGAVIKSAAEKDTVITTDLLLEDIDFRRTTTPPYLLGHKSLAVSLSDIAAMGARPRWTLISIGIPQDVWDTNFVDKFYEGFFELAGRYDVQLIGGDTSRSPDKVVIDSIVMGEVATNAFLRIVSNEFLGRVVVPQILHVRFVQLLSWVVKQECRDALMTMRRRRVAFQDAFCGAAPA